MMTNDDVDGSADTADMPLGDGGGGELLVVPVSECCISVWCGPVGASAGVLGAIGKRHCLLAKRSCGGSLTVFELIPGDAASEKHRVGGPDSMVYVFPGRDPSTEPDQKHEFSVCYECNSDGSDPVACDCLTPKKVGDYPWRRQKDYGPPRGETLSGTAMRYVAARVSGTHFAGPNSNTFAKYFMYRCTEVGKRPPKPGGADGWDFPIGGAADHPPPWGGVVNVQRTRRW